MGDGRWEMGRWRGWREAELYWPFKNPKWTSKPRLIGRLAGDRAPKCDLPTIAVWYLWFINWLHHKAATTAQLVSAILTILTNQHMSFFSFFVSFFFFDRRVHTHSPKHWSIKRKRRAEKDEKTVILSIYISVVLLKNSHVLPKKRSYIYKKKTKKETNKTGKEWRLVILLYPASFIFWAKNVNLRSTPDFASMSLFLLFWLTCVGSLPDIKLDRVGLQYLPSLWVIGMCACQHTKWQR